MSDLPPLPKLTGDIILDVFTHKSLRVNATPTNDLCGDNDRLAELGEKVLNMTTTDVLFNQNPILSAGDISVSQPVSCIFNMKSPLCRKSEKSTFRTRKWTTG
jgi:hypothetical protein